MTKCPHCGCDVDPVKGKPRSPEQLRRFFAVLRAMFNHWPESIDFQPHTEEHLRSWVICQSGRGKIAKTEQLPPISDAELRGEVKAIVTRALSDEKHFPRWKNNTCAVYVPKSIAFPNMGQAEFNKLNDEVEAVYKDKTGLDPDEVLKQTERAA